MNGVFLVSLDFELYWGVRDSLTISDYEANLRGVHDAIPRILELFKSTGIRATWATVGLLFCKDRDEALARAPTLRPGYENVNLCPYRYLEGCQDIDPIYHFAPDLVKQIEATAGQELATHTYSHYYCLEKGQTLEEFEADIRAGMNVARDVGVSNRSIVFPRNQWNPKYLGSLTEFGITSFRGNENSWLYRASDGSGEGKIKRFCRLIDTYLNISGFHTYDLGDCLGGGLKNFPSSRFLRPYNNRLRWLDGMKLHRIKAAMRNAATHDKIFHLWWHPHNFGANVSKNIEFLSAVLDEYQELNAKRSFASLTMSELAAIAGAQ